MVERKVVEIVLNEIGEGVIIVGTHDTDADIAVADVEVV